MHNVQQYTSRALWTMPSWSSSAASASAAPRSVPLLASHSLSVLSKLPLRTMLPSGEKAQATTPNDCPLRVHFTAPLLASHSFSVLS